MVKSEIWKQVPIKEYGGNYLISNYGRLKNIKRNRVLAINCDQDGYPQYLLCANGKRRMFKAHRLVALAFIDNPLCLPCINHRDEDKTNNFVENLEWCTVKHNNNYGTRQQRIVDKISHSIAQISNGNVIAVYKNSIEAERSTGADHSKIRMCCRGERKSTGGYEWKEITKIKG